MSYNNNNNNNNNNRNYYNRNSGSSKKSNAFGGSNNNGESNTGGGNPSDNSYSRRSHEPSDRTNYGSYRSNMSNSGSSYGRYDKYSGKNNHRNSNSSYYYSNHPSNSNFSSSRGGSGDNSNYNSRNPSSFSRRGQTFDRYDSYTDRAQRENSKSTFSRSLPTSRANRDGDDEHPERKQEITNSEDKPHVSSSTSKPTHNLDERNHTNNNHIQSIFEDKPERRFDEPDSINTTQDIGIAENNKSTDTAAELNTENEQKVSNHTEETTNDNFHLKNDEKPKVDSSIQNTEPSGESLVRDNTAQEVVKNETRKQVESNEKLTELNPPKTSFSEYMRSEKDQNKESEKDQYKESEKNRYKESEKDQNKEPGKDQNKEPEKDQNKEPETHKQPTSPRIPEPSSPTQDQLIANSSYLSPIADNASFDGSFVNYLPRVNDEIESSGYKQEDILKEEDDGENISEAETVITNSPPRINRGRKLVRKKDYDEDREKLIRSRKIIDSSADEDESNKYDNSTENISSNFKGVSTKNNCSQRPYKIKRDSSGRSLLQRACKKGNFNDVKRMIERGANPNECDFCGFTCLHEAALEGHVNIVEFLIDNGANVNKQAQQAGDLETPLIDAAENKHYDTVKLLLEKGADPRIFNIDGFTALKKIFNDHDDEEGYEEIIKILEDYNTRFVESNDTKLKHQHKELTLNRTTSPSPSRIIEDPNDNYFSDLLKKKSQASSIYKYAAEGLKEFTANYFVEGGRLDYKPDILLLAARNGHTELVDIILGLAAGNFDINQENNCGLTTLLASVGRGHYEVVEFLLSKGANPNKRRKQDGLNALEVAESASHFDAKEVRLLQEHMNKPYNDSEDDTDMSDNDNSIDMDDSLVSEKNLSKPKHRPVDEIVNKKRKSSQSADEGSNDKKIKKFKIKEPETKNKVSEIKSKEPETRIKTQASSVFSKEKTPDIHEDLRRTKSRDQSFSPSSEASREERKQLTKASKVASASLSPSPMNKAQEEIKAKNVEEARIWQEKVEAKKRARRDMFLKLEKEKERKRKEDEEKRIEEEKRLAIVREEEKKQLAKLAEEKDKELHRKRQVLEKQLTIENYPIGLRTAKFGIQPTANEILQYSPLYTFTINNDKYVTDLQVALLTGTDVCSLTDGLSKETMIEVDSIQKSKLWNLFFSMVGLDKSNPIADTKKLMYEGHAKFQYLLIHFVKLGDILEIIKSKVPETYTAVYENQNLSHVDLNSMQSFLELTKRSVGQLKSTDDADIFIDSKTLEGTSFIPPKLKIRKDALKTIHNSKTPLW